MISDGTENEAHTLRAKLAAVERERDDWRVANETNIEIQRKFQQERDDAESLLASATDLLNSWAREWGVVETFNEQGIKVLINELWDKAANIRLKRDELQQRAQDVRRLVEAARAMLPFFHVAGCGYTTPAGCSCLAHPAALAVAAALKPFEEK